MRRIVQVVLLATLLLPATAQAGPNSVGGYTVLGQGNLPCGEWTKRHAEKDARADVLSVWVTGYLTGINGSAAAGPSDITKGMDLGSLDAWIDDYCAQHPLDSLATAAKELVVELLKRGRAAP
jgi:hypothetical protein